MRRIVSISLLTFLSPFCLFAQDHEIFELDTFIDPSVLTFKVDDENFYMPFLSSQLRMGLVENYHFRDTTGDHDVRFAALTTTFMVNRWQATLRLNQLQQEEDRLDRFKGEAQIAYYSPWKKSPRKMAARYQLSMGWDDTEGRQNKTYGLDMELLFFRIMLESQPIDVIGGFSWDVVDYREEGISSNHYLSWHMRARVRQINAANLIIGIGGGAERTGGGTRCCHGHLEFRLDFPMGVKWLRGNVTYATTSRFAYSTPEEKWNHELGVFMEVSMISKIFDSIS